MTIGTKRFVSLFVLIGFLSALPAYAQPQPGQQHRAPPDIKEYIESLERPDRDKDQKPDEVVKALTITDYMTIADIGSVSTA